MFIQFFLENYENNEIVYIILTSCTPIKELCLEYLPVFVRKIFLSFLKVLVGFMEHLLSGFEWGSA